MIATSPIEDFLSTVLWTAKIQGEQPLSVIVQGPIAGGKSTMIAELQKSPLCHILSDMTTREISKALGKTETKFILLTDMQAIFAHKSTVVTMTTQAIRNLTAEGYYNDPFSGASIRRHLGFIMGIPSGDYEVTQSLNQFLASDIATRFLRIRYTYRKATLSRIHDAIEQGIETPCMNTIPEDDDLIKVTLPPEAASHCRKICMTLKHDMMGTRIHKQIRLLSLARAARNKKTEVGKEELDWLDQTADFIVGNEVKL